MNKLYFKFLLLLFVGGVYFFSPAIARCDSISVKGYIADAEDSSPLANVLVNIKGTTSNTFTNTDGMFELFVQQPGSYILESSLAGYKTASLPVNVEQGKENIFYMRLFPSDFRTGVITVTDDHPRSAFDDLLELSAVLKEKELIRNLGQTLALTLKDQTGISIRSMGPAPSRPVYRGLSGDRVMVTEDGMKSIDLSATSPDHSVAVEPFTIERIEVQRGPKILLKTPSAIGGVINVIRYEIPQQVPAAINFKLGGFGETSNNGYLGSAVISLPIRMFAARLEGSYRKTADLKTPAGKLKNSDIETKNLAGGLSLIQKWGFTGFSIREYQTDYGIPGGFVGAHPNGVDISMLKRNYTFKLHYKIESKFLDHIDLDAARTYYKHTEYESPGVIGAEFRIINYNTYVNLIHNKTGIFSSGTFGASFETRDFNIGGYVFTPPVNSYNTALYLSEEIHASDNLSIELSGRFENNIIKPQQVIQLANLDTVFSRNFNTFSVSASGIYKLSKGLNVGLSLSRSARVPTIEELYSDGPHLAAYSYEIGNPRLEPETALGSELFVYYKDENRYAMLTAFYNDITGYIIPRNTGTINVATLLPVYQTTGVNALLAGLEAQLELKLTKKFEFTSSLSYTYGQIKNTSSPLPQIPPMKGESGLIFNTGKLSIGVNTEYAASQHRLDDFEQPTAGYIIFGAFAQYILSAGKTVHNISLNAENITDKIYYNHLSRIKSILPEPGINFRLTYKLYY
ncbi:MAG TPA: TonB-dependent receptor [Ignavibacteria bacterium]|nr:TonB-dependent receptor [Bacteroidota bacterium]HRF67285.1 TonB-dependent receptor [Ignavibacteria bacterium]HRJ05114.1 TonB-dependent receptor [Ignavibacteria bacterium]HRJ85432.1 TonB-dependent receptor [Ignavibacteria bacterium]